MAKRKKNKLEDAYQVERMQVGGVKRLFGAAHSGDKALPLILPRANLSDKYIEDSAVRFARQLMGEHVTDGTNLKNLAGRTATEVERLKGVDYKLEPWGQVAPEATYTPKAGEVRIAIPGDQTVSNQTLVNLNGMPMHSEQQGGSRYGLGQMHDPDPDKWEAWKSGQTQARNLQAKIDRLAGQYGTNDIIGSHFAMGPVANNYAMHLADANLQAIDWSKINFNELKKFEKLIAYGDKSPKGGRYPDWAGLTDYDAAMDLMRTNTHARKWFNSRMKTPSDTSPVGLPNGLDVQWAVTEPRLRNMEINTTGLMNYQMQPYRAVDKLGFNHNTYTDTLYGKAKGAQEVLTPFEIAFPDAAQHVASTQQPSHFTGTIGKIYPHQVIDDQYINQYMKFIDRVKGLTKKDGGAINAPAASMDGEQFMLAAAKAGMPTDIGSLNKIVDLVNKGLSIDEAIEALTNPMHKRDGGQVEHMQHGGIMPRAGIYYPTSNDERNQAAGLPADFYRKGMTDVASHGYHAGVDVPAGDARLTADLMGSRYVSPQMNKDSINALRLGAEFSVGDGRLRAELMKGLAPNVPTNVGLRYSRPFAEGGSVEHMQAGGLKKGLGVLEDVANSLLKPKPALSPYQLANQKAPLFGQSADPYARSLQQGFEHGWNHGTTGDITSFDRALLGETTGANSAKKGFFFARDPQNPPESLKYKTTDPDSIEMLRKAGVDVDKFNKVSFEGHGADTASDYSRMGGDREYKEAMRNANAAEARRDWPEQERWMQIAEDHEISRMNRDQGLVAKHNDARDVMLEKIRDSFYGTMAGKSQNELSAFNRQYEKMFPENWWNSPFSGQVDDIKRKVVSHLGEENAAPVLDAIKQWQSVGADRIIAENLQSGSNVIPAALRYKNPLVHDFQGSTFRDQTYSDLVDQALKKNHDALILKNTYDPGAGTSKLIDVGVVFDPKNIRSKFAAFDPEHIDSADISKADGGRVEHMQAGGMKKAGSLFLSELDNAIAGVGTAGRTPIVPAPNRWFLNPDKHPHQQGMVERVLERTGRPRESFTSGAFIDPRTGEVLDSKILEDVGVVIDPRTNRPAMSAGKEAGIEQLEKELGLITESNLVRNNIFRRTGGDPMLDDLAFLATVERSGMGHKYGLSTEYGSPVLLNNKMTKAQPSLRPKSRGDVFGMGDVVGQIEIKKGMPHDVYEKLFVAPEGMDVPGVRLHKADGGQVQHMQAGGLKTLMGEVLNRGGSYAARRLERAADEIPNLEKLFQEQALQRAFLGDNARALMTIKPSNFENYAAPIGDLLPASSSNIVDLIGIKNQGGYKDVPFLEVNKKLQGSKGLPFISGHEGRHRNRAMDQSGEQASLVQFLPRSELREPFERRYQDQYINALRQEMALTRNKVMPEKYYESVKDPSGRIVETRDMQRPVIDLPDLYAEGGVAHKQVGGVMGMIEKIMAQKAANTAAKAPKALTPLERQYALEQFKAGSADPRQFYHGSRHYYLDDATSRAVIAPDEGIKNLQTPSQLKNWNYQNNADAVFLTPESSFSNAFAGDIKDAQARPAVYPVHAQVKNPFDIHNQDHAKALIDAYRRMHIAPDDVEKLGRFEKDVAFAQRDPANWATLENNRVQDAIKSLGHDSFYVTENGIKNLGVYNPNLIKSSLGNRGTFDINEADMGKADGGAVHMQMGGMQPEPAGGSARQETFAAQHMEEGGDIMRSLFDHALDNGDIHEMTHAMLVKQHEAEHG